MTSRRVRLAAAPLLAASLFLAGCAGATSGSARESEAGKTPSETPTPMDPQQKGFYRCLEKHGVALDKDSGQLRVDKDKYDAAASKKAQEKCVDLLPSPEEMEAAAKVRAEHLAVCMRKQGVRHYPDPEPKTGEIEFSSGVTGDPAFRAASAACEERAAIEGSASGR